jgi:hypothetical protein
MILLSRTRDAYVIDSTATLTQAMAGYRDTLFRITF